MSLFTNREQVIFSYTGLKEIDCDIRSKGVLFSFFSLFFFFFFFFSNPNIVTTEVLKGNRQVNNLTGNEVLQEEKGRHGKVWDDSLWLTLVRKMSSASLPRWIQKLNKPRRLQLKFSCARKHYQGNLSMSLYK